MVKTAAFDAADLSLLRDLGGGRRGARGRVCARFECARDA